MKSPVKNIKRCLNELKYVKKTILKELNNSNLPPRDMEWLSEIVESACVLPEDIPRELREGALSVVENLIRESELVRRRSDFSGTIIAVKYPQIQEYFSDEIEKRLKGAIKMIDEIFEDFEGAVAKDG